MTNNTTPDTTAESTAVAIPTQSAPTIAPYDPMSAVHLQMWTSLDLSDPANKILAMAAIQSATDPKRIGDAIGQTLEVEHAVVHRVQFADEDGVEVEADRVVFITPTGEMWATVSHGVVRSLQLLVGMYGTLPWRPAMHVQIQQKRTRRGWLTLQLTPVLHKPTTTKTGK